MPGWQAIYEELRPAGFELVAVAQDTGGAPAAEPYYAAADATFTALFDPRHVVSSLYDMVNVPTGVWIDEAGRIVRPNEVAFSRDFSFLNEHVRGDDYVAALRDWVSRGSGSPYALGAGDVAARRGARSRESALADASFRMAVHFHGLGDAQRAARWWARAQELRPGSWSHHRQAWVFESEDDRRGRWMRKYEGLEGEPYYAPLELGAADPP